MNDVDVFLEHYGVKGMRWGIRKDITNSISQFNDDVQKKIKGVFSDKDFRSDQLNRKYGPYTGKDDDKGFHLTDKQKKIALGVGIGVGGALLAGGAIYLGKKYGVGSDFLLDVKGLQDDYAQLNLEQLKVLSESPMSTLEGVVPGLDDHWGTKIDLPAGSIFKRLSTIQETEIRPQGFFAAFEDSDVQRYKAELPKWWKTWGYDNKSGWLVNLRSQVPIKAPSGEETFNIFKNLLRDQRIIANTPVGRIWGTLSEVDKEKAIDGLAKQNFGNFVIQWANGLDGHPDVQQFFKMVKDSGYNALIDFNDSGRLAKTPLRLLNGSDFQLDTLNAHTFVGESEIKLMQMTLGELFMAAINDVDNFLVHFGIKGMRWGVRNDKRRLARDVKLTPRQRRARKMRRKAAKGAAIGAAKSLVFTVPFALALYALRQENSGPRNFKFDPPNFGGYNARGNAGRARNVSQTAQEFIESQRETQMYSLRRMRAEGKMDASQFSNFAEILNKRFDRKVAAVL